MRPAVYVTRRLPSQVLDALRLRFAVTSADAESVDSEDLAAAFRTHDAIPTTIGDKIDQTILAQPDRRAAIVANFGARLDHVDLVSAHEEGVVVTNTPDAVTDATAELAVLLMLMAARRAGEGECEVRAASWTGWQPTHLLGSTLSGKVLGLVGFGLIGQATARKASGLGVAVQYHARHPVSHKVEGPAGAAYVETLDQLISTSDVISLHVPGGAPTRRMIDSGIIARMKTGAIVVNTARGSIIDEEARAKALTDGRLGAVGLDVYEKEPAVHPLLLASPRAVLLPHLGSATLEARTAMGMQALANLDSYFSGRGPPNRVA